MLVAVGATLAIGSGVFVGTGGFIRSTGSSAAARLAELVNRSRPSTADANPAA
jgi:H+/Cl- antiporter ClcA